MNACDNSKNERINTIDIDTCNDNKENNTLNTTVNYSSCDNHTVNINKDNDETVAEIEQNDDYSNKIVTSHDSTSIKKSINSSHALSNNEFDKQELNPVETVNTLLPLRNTKNVEQSSSMEIDCSENTTIIQFENTQDNRPINSSCLKINNEVVRQSDGEKSNCTLNNTIDITGSSLECTLVNKPIVSSDHFLLQQNYFVGFQNKTILEDKLTKLHSCHHLSNLPPISSLLRLYPKHYVLFSCNKLENTEQCAPFPNNFQDSWDNRHVKMPCSQQNTLKTGKKFNNRWEIICNTLKEIKSVDQLCSAILFYNPKYFEKWNLKILKDYIQCFEDEKELFKPSGLISKVVKLAIDLPKICTKKIPLLKINSSNHITLSQQQVGSLLANAFFCTFPKRNATGKSSYEYSNYSSINFSSLFNETAYRKNEVFNRKFEKLKCIFNYFKRITEEKFNIGAITISRHRIEDKNLPKWETISEKCYPVYITETRITNHEYSEIDFANKYIGGGVLSHGLVQEEIKFIQCPELIVTRLFTEMLTENECLVVIGAEKFNETSGYADNFLFEDNYSDNTPRDSWNRKINEVIAIDAICFQSFTDQFDASKIKRELKKAYIGFNDYENKNNKSSIATGNWGCGAFNGDRKLKFIIQVIAASAASRSLYYSTFGDILARDELIEMYTCLMSKEVSVSFLFNAILKYKNSELFKNGENIFTFIKSELITNG